MKLFTLEVELDMDSADFQKQFKAAEKQMREFKKQVKEAQEPVDPLREKMKKLSDRNSELSQKNKELVQELAKLKKQATQTGDGLDKLANKTKDSGTSLSGFAQDFKNAFTFSAGTLLANAIKGAVSAAIQLGQEGIALASDLEEVQNVVDVTFGTGANTINAWAKAAQSSFGMSELKAKKYSSTIGAMVKSMGLSSDEALSMSQSLTELAGDMASFYNLEHEEAFEKIRAGISGETEPLKQLGINMSVANLEAYALSQGINTAYNSMTQAQQAMLRYNYLLSVTGDAQGDFARTSDNYANAIKTLEDNANSLIASAGQWGIDVITPMINDVNALFEQNTFKIAIDEAKSKKNADVEAANASYAQADYLIGKLESGELAEGTEEWKSALDALVRVMPQLGSYIDTNTGKLMVSTEQLRENAAAVRDLAVYDAKQGAIASYNQIAEDAAKARADKQVELWIAQAALQQYGELSGLKKAENRYAYYTRGGFYNFFGIESDWKSQEEATRKVEELEKELEQLAEAEAQASKEAEVVELALQGYKGATLESSLAARDYSNAMDDHSAALSAVQEKAEQLSTAYNDLKKAARESIASMMSGFSVMDMQGKTQLTGGKGDDASLENRLKNETAYMEQYAANLQIAMTSGLDDGLVAQLADGSEDSAAILRSLSETSGEERDTIVATLNEAWAANQAAMDEMAEAMATSQSKVDENIQALKDQLVSLVETANQKDEARRNITVTLDAIDATIREKEGALASSVASVNAILAQLGYVDGVDYGGTAHQSPTPEFNAKGLGYVPYNDYLTYLHKGEAVLSRTEAERYRAGQVSQPAGIDYDMLAGAIAAAMNGSTVQMDGQAVGQLVAPTVSRAIQQEARAGRYAV